MNRCSVIFPTSHIFGGPYVETLLISLSNSYESVNLFSLNVDTKIENYFNSALDTQNINFEYIKIKKNGFYENRTYSLLKIIIALLRKKNLGTCIGVGFRGGLICLILNIFLKKEFFYYSLETYNNVNSSKIWPLIKLLQNLIVRRASKIIIQSKDRLKVLENETGVDLSNKSLFQANSPSIRFKISSMIRNKILYSGAVSANWSGSLYLETVIKSLDSNQVYIDDRIKKKDILFPHDHYSFVSSFIAGIAFYDSKNDNNISVIGFSSGKINTYLKCGIPVIINDIEPYASLINKFECGLLVHTNSSENDIKDFISHVKNNRNLYRKRCKDCINFIESFNTF
jgi:hypothetical protein